MNTCFCMRTFGWVIVVTCFLVASQAGAQSPFDDAVAYWAFEGTGDTIIDSKGVANMALADGLNSPTRITGLVGGGLQVNPGDNQYITTGADVDALDFNRETLDAFSVACWVKQYEGSPLMIKMADTATDNYRGWHLECKNTGEIDFLLRSTNATTDKIAIYGLGRVPMGEWVHLAATFDYNLSDETRGVRLYVNGHAYDMDPVHTGLEDGNPNLDTTNDKPFQFTARETSEYLQVYETCYDEVGVWNRVLSQTEVQQLVNTGVPDVPVTNYIDNGDFEDTTGWVAPGTGVLPPADWASHIWKNNPAAQATGATAVGGTGNSALMEEARLTETNQRGMAQSFVHATDSEWQFDMDFATEAPSETGQRTVAMTLRAENGSQLSIIVSDPDNDGMGDLQVGFGVYTTIPGLENKIVFDSDLSDLTGSVHHLRIVGHFDDEIPNYDVILTDPSDNVYSALAVTMYSQDMGELTTGTGLSQVGFYTYKSYGDWVIDNVSLVDAAYVPVPGDTNEDDDVDADDLAVVAANWGNTVGANDYTVGNFNGDTVVDAIDAAIQAANWTGPGESNSGTSVPEPGAAVLLAILGLTMLYKRHVRH